MISKEGFVTDCGAVSPSHAISPRSSATVRDLIFISWNSRTRFDPRQCRFRITAMSISYHMPLRLCLSRQEARLLTTIPSAVRATERAMQEMMSEILDDLPGDEESPEMTVNETGVFAAVSGLVHSTLSPPS